MANYNQVSYGSSDKETVKKLQEMLNSTGNYNLATDGIFGTQTQAAVKKYQQEKGLAVDGIVGKNTWSALTSSQGSSSSGATQTTAPEETKAPTFAYPDYKPSDTVAQAEALLQQQLAQKPGSYTSPWQDQLNEMLQKILNREKFSYDMNGDALYQQYKDQHTTQGKLAMMDAMGRAQAMSGGYGNSYAQSVGQQAYQGYLQQLNERIPELYQLALDQYTREGDEMDEQFALMAQMENQDYGRYRDSVSDYYTELDRLTEDARYQGEMDYDKWADDRTFGYGQYIDDRNLAYQQERDKVADEQWQAQFDEAKRQYDQQYALSASKGSGGGGGGGGGGGNDNDTGKTGNGTYADTLWYATGTYDDNGNPIFRNSEGKTQAFGQGINPYTGTKHSDAKYGTFSNGYQPNNIGGTKLKNSGMSTTITGKSQTIWEANGKYWIWRGDLNKYVEVDIGDMG